MTQIRIEGVTKSYGDTRALDEVSLEIGGGELFFLLGPSGCGKTTLLRMIAGLQMPDCGRILFDGNDVTPVPTQKRNAVMCFQGYALWPHMTVRENIRFGLSVRESPAGLERQLAAVERVLEIIQMQGDLADRKPQQLSGGQQQRVALARAIVVAPACLLLDEPLSNLDTNLRQQMRREIQQICRRAGVTTVWVTHDQKEALSTADRIAVMQDGRLAQVGTPAQLYRQPLSAFVAEFIGPTNLIAGEVAGSDERFVHVATAVGTLVCARREVAPAAGRVIVSIRPELVRIGRDAGAAPDGRLGTGGPGGGWPDGSLGAGCAGGGRRDGSSDIRGPVGANRLPGVIVENTFLGQSSEHLIAAGDGHLRVMSTPPVYDLGGGVTLEIDPANVVVLSR